MRTMMKRTVFTLTLIASIQLFSFSQPNALHKKLNTAVDRFFLQFEENSSVTENQFSTSRSSFVLMFDDNSTIFNDLSRSESQYTNIPVADYYNQMETHYTKGLNVSVFNLWKKVDEAKSQVNVEFVKVVTYDGKSDTTWLNAVLSYNMDNGGEVKKLKILKILPDNKNISLIFAFKDSRGDPVANLPINVLMPNGKVEIQTTNPNGKIYVYGLSLSDTLGFFAWKEGYRFFENIVVDTYLEEAKSRTFIIDELKFMERFRYQNYRFSQYMNFSFQAADLTNFYTNPGLDYVPSLRGLDTRGILGLGAGAKVEMYLVGNLSLGLGIEIDYRSQKLFYDELDLNYRLDNISEPKSTVYQQILFQDVDENQKSLFVGIPVSLNYYFDLSDRLEIGIHSGMRVNQQIYNKSTVDFSEANYGADVHTSDENSGTVISKIRYKPEDADKPAYEIFGIADYENLDFKPEEPFLPMLSAFGGISVHYEFKGGNRFFLSYNYEKYLNGGTTSEELYQPVSNYNYNSIQNAYNTREIAGSRIEIGFCCKVMNLNKIKERANW
jgi:hypothetical protein